MNAIALDELISGFRATAFNMFSPREESYAENFSGARRATGEGIGEGQAEALLLWRENAGQMLRRISKALTSTLHQAAEAITLWTEHWVPSSPHQELIPWCGWLRAVASRRLTWLIAYPEEEYLHP